VRSVGDSIFVDGEDVCAARMFGDRALILSFSFASLSDSAASPRCKYVEQPRPPQHTKHNNRATPADSDVGTGMLEMLVRTDRCQRLKKAHRLFWQRCLFGT